MTDTAELKPVAWRVKDYADGWIIYTNEKRARIESVVMSGALVEPLYSADALSSLVRERDEANSDAAIYAKTLMKFRDTLLLVRDGMEDEGDRVYFGSTNDADDLKAIIEKIDGMAWDEIMASSQPPVDLYAIIAEQRARATAAEADAARMREALIAAQRWITNIDNSAPVVRTIRNAMKKDNADV